MLQALDLLSLFLCMVDLEQPTDVAAPIVRVQATLRELDQPAGPRSVSAVPTRRGGEHIALTAGVLAAGTVSVTPFPFSGSTIEVSIPVRRLPQGRYATPAHAAEAYHAAPLSPVRCTLVADPLPTRAAG